MPPVAVVTSLGLQHDQNRRAAEGTSAKRSSISARSIKGALACRFWRARRLYRSLMFGNPPLGTQFVADANRAGSSISRCTSGLSRNAGRVMIAWTDFGGSPNVTASQVSF